MENQSQNKEAKSSYRSIFKATSLFGGVQLYQILIRLIRGKFVAVLLGPVGIGIQGLLTSATDIIQNISSMGLSKSAVKDVSSACGNGNDKRVGEVVAVIRKLVWLTGLLGMLGVVVLSPQLSNWSFGNSEYILAFSILSITLLFDQLTAGQRVVMQGTRQLKNLAKASAIGVTVGLLVTVPFYFFWGEKGIVPALVVNSLATLAISYYFSNKVKIERVSVTWKDTFAQGKSMVMMGLAMCLSSVLVSLSSYIVRGYIRYCDGTEMVGLYTAGVTIASSYVGLIFSAMDTDFYPRLAAVNSDNVACRKIVNQQGEIGALLLGPMVLVCVLFMPIVVRILYSSEFLPSCNYLTLAIVGMLIRLPSWLIAIQFVAKGEAKLFVINETVSCLYFLFFNIIGYKLGGLVGIGIAFIVGYLVYVIQVFVIATKRYEFSFSKQFVRIFLVQLLFAIVALVISLTCGDICRYLIGSVLCLLLFGYSYFELNRRIDISKFIKEKIHKK